MDITHQSSKLKKEHDVVHSIDLLIKNGHSMVAACHHLGIPSLNFHHWHKVIKKVNKLKDKDEFFPLKKSEGERKIHPMCSDRLDPSKEQISTFISKS